MLADEPDVPLFDFPVGVSHNSELPGHFVLGEPFLGPYAENILLYASVVHNLEIVSPQKYPERP